MLLLGCFEDGEDVGYAYVFNGRLPPTDFLQYVLADFGLPASGKNKCELLLDPDKFFISRGSKRMTSVLIVDEAHDLSADTLEEIRLLSNLETPEDKLLQIVLSGQPRASIELDSVELRQLKQRIALRTQLAALNANQTQEYIEQRLRIAGAASNATPIFSSPAVAAVYSYSRGFPRLINTICENALVSVTQDSPQL